MPSRRKSTLALGLALAALGVISQDPCSAAEPSPSDPKAGRSHWAFQPLSVRPAFASASAPGVPGWSRSPIDEYVLARLRSVQLTPADDAPRRVLIRRVYFQLIGLPPSPAQVEAFLADERPDALDRVVDQLLVSPQFGECWGRHWLDLARYADSNGLDENFLFREAWRYRNWVIDALNTELPFDRFVLEQLAGDLLPYESIAQRDRQRIASGFLVVGPKVLLGNDPQRQRMEVADEQIDTMGRTFLGLTLGCARCHDHKFEPVPRADYYALAGILTSTRVVEQRYMLGEQRVMERLVGLGPDGDVLNANYEKYWREVPKVKSRATDAKTALGLLEKGDADALKLFLANHADAVAEGARNEALPMEQRIADQKRWVAELAAILDQPPKIPPRAMIPADVEAPADEAIRVAGQFDRIGDRVPRGFLQVLSDGAETKIPQGKSGRLEMAQWLTDVDHGAGVLTARVIVNRVWYHLIGRGLVGTLDNFGRTGEAPSHPELLDYLARELIASGWSLKSVVRQIVLSRTFAMSSAANPAAQRVDPENRLLWRAHRRRLEPEALRDAMLAAAGQLQLSKTDSTVSYLGDQATAVGKNEVRRRTDLPCRSVYLPVIRNDLPELFQSFDFADPHATTGARPQTASATQALFLLNDRTVMDASDALARRLLADAGTGATDTRIRQLFEWTLGGPPTADELEAFRAGVADFEQRVAARGDSEPPVRVWSLACQAVFALSRFQFLD